MEELGAQRRGLAEDMQDGEECLSPRPQPCAFWVCSIVFGHTLHVLCVQMFLGCIPDSILFYTALPEYQKECEARDKSPQSL